MPRDISSSSSEDEAESPTQKSPEKQKESDKKTTRYQCPADFVSFHHKPCSSTLTESLKNNKNELWLIKAPVSFNPECFSGIKVPLSGLQTVKVPTTAGGAQTASSRQIFSILASTHGTSGLSLLTSNKKSSDGVAFGPTFSGLLNVCESYGDSSTNQAPHIIPAAPAPSIPPGLKQRFHPFGSKTPTLTCVAESETDGAAFGPSSTTLRPLVAKRFTDETWHREEEEEGRKKKKKKKEKREEELQQEVRVKVKVEPVTEIQDAVMMEEEGDASEERRVKKKKKKEKRIKTEREEEPQHEVRVKVEPVTEIQYGVMMEEEGDASEERRKKKKKKKDREREEVEEGVEPSVSVKVEVKSEPIDTSYGDTVEGSPKKKKKKKKSKTDDD